MILQRATPENLQALDQRLAGTDAVQIPFWLAEMHTMLAWGQFNDADPALFFVDTGLASKAFTALESDLRAGRHHARLARGGVRWWRRRHGP